MATTGLADTDEPSRSSQPLTFDPSDGQRLACLCDEHNAVVATTTVPVAERIAVGVDRGPAVMSTTARRDDGRDRGDVTETAAD